MDSATFKRDVFRTVGVKTAKFGLRNTARSNADANLFHGIMGLNTEVGGMLQGLQPYLLGFQLSPELLQNAFLSLGGVGYYAVMVAKTLKVKVPGAGKKSKLKDMTPTEALLTLDQLAGDLLYAAMGVFHSGEVSKADAAVAIEQFMKVLWPVAYDLVSVPMSDVFENYVERIAPAYPVGLFSTNEEMIGNAKTAMLADEDQHIQQYVDARKQAQAVKKSAKLAVKLAKEGMDKAEKAEAA
jgi:hypothetical protein